MAYNSENNNYNQQNNIQQSCLRSAPKRKKSKQFIIIAVMAAVCFFSIAATVAIVVLHGVLNHDKNADEGPKDKYNHEEELNDETYTEDEQDNVFETLAPIEITTTVPETEPAPENAEIFVRASASSVLSDQGDHNYSATNVLRNDDSCWCENAVGTGVGEWIKLELPETQILNGIAVVNGYAGTERQYTHNGKLRDITLMFSNGSSESFTLEVFGVDDRNIVQNIELTNPVETSYVIIRIDSVVAGECDDTCLTFVDPY